MVKYYIQTQIQMSTNRLFRIVIVSTILLVGLVNCYQDPSACVSSSNQFYDIIHLQCASCPTNTVTAKDNTFCNCSTSYYHNPDVIGFNNSQSCKTLNSSYTTSTQVASVYDLDGTYNPTIVTCSNAYPDSTNSRCIPCGPNQTYNTTLSACTCSGSSYQIAGQCYTNQNSSWTPTNSATSKPNDYLAQINAVVGCGQYGLIQSCNQLINKCVDSGYSTSDFFCKLLAGYQTTKSPSTGLPTYSFSGQITTSLSIYASSIVGTNTSTVKNTFQFYLAEYKADGSLNDFKSMDNSIFSCEMNQGDVVSFMSFGLNFYKQCSTVKTFANIYYYQVYIVDASGNLNEVPVFISNTYYKRFLPSVYNSIELNLLSGPPLQTPYLSLSSKSPAVVSSNSNASSTTLNYMPFLAVIAVIMVVTFIIDFFRYMRYNPDENNDPYYCCKAIFLFLVHIVKFIAVTVWIWLLLLSGFCFCFYKFQQTVYLILPSASNDSTGLYSIFMAMFYITFAFTVVAIFILMFNLVNSTDYFLIDWEKEKDLGKFQINKNKKQVSVWRKVLLVNELYELSVSRTINIELVSLFSVLFLCGLNWINLNSMVPNTSNLVTDNKISTSPILSYFIITFIIFAIAILQFLIRHAVKTWYPLPVQNFVDLCSVSNLSIMIFDQALHGYYIHGMNSMGQSQGSLSYIQSMFQKEGKSFGKSRSFRLQDADQCQTFEVIFPYEIRQAFQVKYKSRFNQKLAGKAYNTSVISNPIPEMLNEEDYRDLEQINNTMLQTFKYYLEGVKTAPLNIRERSLMEKIVNCPIDTSMMGKLPVFFKDLWYEFNSVMLCGHEFILLFNFINFVNIFYIALGNVFVAFLIALAFEKLFHFIYSFFIKRNISKNTLIDDKFFN